MCMMLTHIFIIKMLRCLNWRSKIFLVRPVAHYLRLSQNQADL
nr:hypothetical protein Iba_scaffold43041CG0020 [Ipomoea batatas]GMD30635.1 hypothetical protein Iba_chr09aCG8870 [Ipomoea batatas]GMD32488.1 hypothetical protein Iba_chr09bCG8690 [Ipomoea batatas]GMD33908.1 hypothetical protein Iba_chr09cCG7030 [Ipomoea batatas]GMD37403.1 hypothetical protein Iba_chr09eCG8970 [Ipomoea batatas]